MGTPYRGAVRSLGVRREVEDIRISSRCEHNHVGSVAIQLARHQIARYNASRSAIDKDYVKQFTPEMHRDCPSGYLLFECLVSAEQKLLPRLASCVESSFDLHTAKGAIVEKSAILPCKRHALSHALIDDIAADFCQPIHV